MTIVPKSDFRIRICLTFNNGSMIKKVKVYDDNEDEAKKKKFLESQFNIEKLDLGRGNLKTQRVKLFSFVDKIIGDVALWETMQKNISVIRSERLKLEPKDTR